MCVRLPILPACNLRETIQFCSHVDLATNLEENTINDQQVPLRNIKKNALQVWLTNFDAYRLQIFPGSIF